MDEKLNDLYRDILMDHYKYPRGNKNLDNFDLENEGYNPACGDDIHLKIRLDGGKIDDISVDCIGCAISVASGSMLADIVRGKSLEEVIKIAKAVKAMLKGEKLSEDINLGDLEALKGVSKFPVRIKCALLSWTTIIDALEARQAGQKAEISRTE